MMTILTVVGTRPEAIKLAPVIKELARRVGDVRSVVCATGQHHELLTQGLCPFGIQPDHDLAVMRPGQDPTTVCAQILLGLKSVLDVTKPDWVVVQGDTSTALAGALGAFYAGTCVAHVEAGLRSGRSRHPFPEEINRRAVDSIADLLLAPTTIARENLMREGHTADRIVVTGNTVVDAATYALSLTPTEDSVGWVPEGGRLLFVTAHRRESHGRPLNEICLGLRDIADGDPAVRIVFPVHPSPAVQETVFRALDGHPRIRLASPMDYVSTIHLLRSAFAVLTDSGGIQEEATALGVPVLLLREVTDRPEGVQAGVVRIVGTERTAVGREYARLVREPIERSVMARAQAVYGDGHAAERIVDALLSTCGDDRLCPPAGSSTPSGPGR